MTGYVTDASGGTYELPVLLSWELTHTDGDAADAFAMRCVFEPEMAPLLRSAARFRATDGGKTVFCGVIDECRALIDESGSFFDISGRSLAALLMDNEAEAAEYALCSIEDILREHVRPWGITDISCGKLGNLSGYTVRSGESEWKALSGFVQWTGGGTPRFSKSGRLLINTSAGDMIALNENSGITRLDYREKRYGVISEVLVKGNTNGQRSTVCNSDFIARGGLCRRIVCVPNATRYDAMRYTGEYQIERSEREESVVTVTLIEPLFAFAGDTIKAELPHLGVSGSFTVMESVSWADGTGCGTELKLAPKK